MFIQSKLRHSYKTSLISSKEGNENEDYYYYEGKYALLSTPTKLGVGLITKTAALKPPSSPLCFYNAFIIG